MDVCRCRMRMRFPWLIGASRGGLEPKSAKGGNGSRCRPSLRALWLRAYSGSAEAVFVDSLYVAVGCIAESTLFAQLADDQLAEAQLAFAQLADAQLAEAQ